MSPYKITVEDEKKLDLLNNQKVLNVVKDAIDLMKPDTVLVFNDSQEDVDKVRKLAIDHGEETKLTMEGHTIHYDGYNDQARDKANTATLLPVGQKLSRGLNVKERESGLKEIFGIMDGSMRGKTMIVRFFCLGPEKSRFAIRAMQITDSFYVAHSEDLLYRPGYEEFKRLEDKDDFLYFWHSAGELDGRNTTVNVDKRRIYIDPFENRVLSVNNQYAGNSLACKLHSTHWIAIGKRISLVHTLAHAGKHPQQCCQVQRSLVMTSLI
jgi:phosphoenolpyruvate carboxykinase (GTP)